ncbi:MAG: hypothetical protein ABL984_00555 [Pyrinomonadaceae bacterium]
MKHKGRTPAIYASARKAYLISPGQPIPGRSSLITVHANMEVLAIAYAKSTNGNLDGSRAPSSGSLRSFHANVEAVLSRVVNANIGAVSLPEFEILRHTLGYSHLSTETPTLGWRNYYQIDSLEGLDGEAVAGLVGRGLMEEFKPGYYRATDRGKAIAGAEDEERFGKVE